MINTLFSEFPTIAKELISDSISKAKTIVGCSTDGRIKNKSELEANEARKILQKIIDARKRVMFFDVETTGLPKSYSAPTTDMNNWPRVVELAWEIWECDSDQNWVLIQEYSHIVKPFNFFIPEFVSKIHGITQKKAVDKGFSLSSILADTAFSLKKYKVQALVAHNIDFDYPVLAAEFNRLQVESNFDDIKRICTMKSTADLCNIKKSHGKSNKFPKLIELHQCLFKQSFDGAHRASIDVEALRKCFIELCKQQITWNNGDYKQKVKNEN